MEEDAYKKYSIDTTDYEIGQDNVQKWGFDIHNPVFGISAGLILLFLGSLLFIDPSVAKETLNTVKNTIIDDFDAFFMWSANFFVLFTFVIMLSPLGKIRIGGKDSIPDHSRGSWLAMLFAAGMGIGLLFWGWQSQRLTSPIGGAHHLTLHR